MCVRVYLCACVCEKERACVSEYVHACVNEPVKFTTESKVKYSHAENLGLCMMKHH